MRGGLVRSLWRYGILMVVLTLVGWGAGLAAIPHSVHLTPEVHAASPAVLSAEAPWGHIAFSFWNRAPERCTYEINVIDVAACLKGAEECQAKRLVFPLNNVSEPALSPSGTRIAFRGWGEPSSKESPFYGCAPAVAVRALANTTLDGSDLRITGGYWEDSHPDWSPDGARLLFDSTRVGDGISRIYVIDADGSNEGDLRIAGQHPAWAPDGQRFVYRGCDLTGNRCGLWIGSPWPVKPWETGQNMVGPIVLDEQASHPDWSPVADEVVYQTRSGDQWSMMRSDVRLVSEASPPVAQVLLREPGRHGLPVWSPDGQWIAYVSDAGDNWGIWIMRRDGSERRQLFAFDGGVYALPRAWEPYGARDWLDEQIAWSR
ncbi:MAG: TolB family protein [Anaerolineae bacterium]